MPSNDETLVICRCEEVTKAEIFEAIREGCRTLDEIKRMTRAGMGLCQGRTCSHLISQILQQEGVLSERAATPMKVRFPLRPVTLEAIALGAEDVPEWLATNEREE